MKASNDTVSKSVRQQGKPLSWDEKWLVLNIYQRCRDESLNQKNTTSNAYQRAAYYAGVSRKVVVEIVSHYRKTGTIPPPVEAGNQSNHKTLIQYNTTSKIRQFILESHQEGTACTSKHIQDLLHKKFHLEVPLRTVQRHLHRLGFEYKRNHTPKKHNLREKQSVRQQRHSYLHEIHKIRQNGYTIVYLDESFLHHYHGQKFSWFSEDDFLDIPSGKGKRWCFIHAISEFNMIPNALMIFEGKNSKEDYHGSFNFEVFYNWFQNKFLPNLPQKSCIVMDRATYHMVPEERLIPSQMKKSDIHKWLTEHSIYWEESWLKPQLVTTLEKHIDKTPIVQKEAHKNGHELLILPVHHPELNPIELVWAYVKNECAKKLRNDLTFTEVLENLKESFNNLSGQMCQNFYKHVIKTEKELWTLDLELDSIDEFIDNDTEKLRSFLTHL